MTTSAVFWEGSSGDWFDPAHWNTGVIPGAADDTNIDAPGSYTVTLTAPATVASLTIAAFSATLDIADPGGIETIAGGLSNSGIVEVDASSQGGTTVSIGGALTNDGRFTIGNGTLSVPTTVSAAGLTDTGTITIEGGSAGQAALIVNDSALSTWGGRARYQRQRPAAIRLGRHHGDRQRRQHQSVGTACPRGAVGRPVEQ
jgi:hypothetical protein